MINSEGLWAFILLSAVIVPVCLQGAGAPTPVASRKAVVVELFTAEGCSTCPPADELLGRLRQEKFPDGLEVIPLGLHVDYWNSQGWKDRFSSVDYTQRQEKYAQQFHLGELYTPQMVVDGSVAVTGNDAPRVLQVVSQAAQRPQVADIQISTAAEKLTVIVKAEQSAGGTVMLALTEDNLTSKVSAGENNGRELHHSAVVRKLQPLGPLRNGSFETSVLLSIRKDWKREDMRIVVFVQESYSGRIDGAATAAVPLP
ncbi:MAG TPA: DUF1223 domain-containing protein [Candidatus Angelobacter sp.]